MNKAGEDGPKGSPQKNLGPKNYNRGNLNLIDLGLVGFHVILMRQYSFPSMKPRCFLDHFFGHRMKDADY